MEKVEGYLIDGRFFRTKEEAEEAELVKHIIDRLHTNNMLGSITSSLDITRALNYVIANYQVTPKVCK